jgi:muramoyltetrapeptide carboxypeptidase
MKQQKKKIKLISPSGAVHTDYLDRASEVLTHWGFEVSEGLYARAVHGRYAGSESQRIQDLQDAINDDSLTAILCSRGGYGLSQIIDKIDFTPLLKHPKLIIGFSDITILHAALSRMNTPSVHGVMAKQLAEFDNEDDSLLTLREILNGQLPHYHIEPDALNRYGQARGKLVGGNLSVLMGLRNTPFEPDYQDNILFIEDIGEEAYRIDRMMQNLRLGGVFKKISGLMVGYFTNCPEDPSMHKTVKEIILDAVTDYDFPVCAHFPAGHEHPNFSLVMNKEMGLQITDEGTAISFS